MKSSRILELLLPLFACLMFTVPSTKAADWPAIAPEEQSMTTITQQPGAPAVILFRQETDDDKLHSRAVYMRVKILTEAGRKYGDVELPYDRRGFTIEQVSGRTVHTDGSVIPFEGKPFDKVIAKGRNIRYQVKSFSLPDVQVGSILDYRYTLFYGDNSLMAPEWSIQSDLFEKKIAFKFIPYQMGNNTYVIVDHGRTANGIAWTPYLPAGHSPQLQTSPDGKTWVDLHMEDVPAQVEEPYMPPSNALRWRVQFYYQVELKADEYWKKQGKFWNKDTENFLKHNNGVADATAKVLLSGDTPEIKVRKIYSFVSELENLSYTPSRSQQEEQTLGIKPIENVEDVLRQHGGSHDQLNKLFVAMVRQAGIPAWVMGVADREEHFFSTEFLSTSQLDAEVAIVKLDGKDVFLDPGTKYCPYGMLSWHYSGSRGLRQTDKDAELADSALPTYLQAFTKRIAKVQLTEQGAMEGSIIVGFTGLEAMRRRREGNRTDAEGRKKILEDEMRSWLPGGAEVALTNTPDWDKTESMLVAQFKVSAPLASAAGKRWIVPGHLFQINDKPLFSSPERLNPVYFDYPSREVDEVHIALPPNVEIESLPADDQVKLEYALYSGQEKREGANGILATRDLVMAYSIFTVKEYKDVKGFYDKVKTADDQPVLLKSAHAQGN